MNSNMLKYDVTKVTDSTIRNITLDGIYALKAESATIEFEVKRPLNPVTLKPIGRSTRSVLKEQVTPLIYKLKEVSKNELIEYRQLNIPSFVLKYNGKLYYTQVDFNINFIALNLLNRHMCGKNCCHLSAASDENGGCLKVRQYSQGIENYPWITYGYETFATIHDSFVVADCSHYKMCSPQKKLSVVEANILKNTLAQYIFGD